MPWALTADTLDNTSVAADLKPLLKAGWTTTLLADNERMFVMVQSPVKLDGTFITIRNAEEAAYYEGGLGDAITFTGPDAIIDGVALALGRAG